MRIDTIKTKTEFYEFAEIWHQRAIRLHDIWLNTKETKEKRNKAFFLYIIMYCRLIKLVHIAVEMHQSKNFSKFKSGGYIF